MTPVHLSDCFMDVVAYVACLPASAETKQPPYEDVRNEIRRLLAESEAFAARGPFTRDDYDQARFAICAWIDEAILSSPWLHKNLWLNDQLQRLHYNTTDAGEQFFEHLYRVELHQRDLREVYYLCLALGFAGRYCRPGDEFHLERIRTSNLKILLGCSDGLPSLEQGDLFPEAHPDKDSEYSKLREELGSGTGTARAGSRLVGAVCLAAPVLLFCILYLVYRFTLSGISENFLRTVTN